MKKSCPKSLCFDIDIGKVNAFGKADIMALDAYISDLNQQWPHIRGLVIQSQKISPGGLPIFCAGADQRERVDWSNAEILAHVQYQRQVVHRLRTSPFWVIACVDGIAYGLGTELCLAADFVIASEKACFAFPEKDWGIVPGAGGSAWAYGWAEHKEYAQEMISTGEKIEVQKAHWLGIVDVCVESKDFEVYVQEIMSWISTMTPNEQQQRKIDHWKKIDFEKWFRLEQESYQESLKTRA